MFFIRYLRIITRFMLITHCFEMAIRLKGLTNEDRLVLQVIEQSGNMGTVDFF